MSEQLKRCPFCGSNELDVDLKGTQPSISCNDCGDGYVSIQTCDHFTDEERFNDPDFEFRYDPHYDYGIKGTQRALDVLTARWNTRYITDERRDWREIESAPRDGTHILLWWPHWYHTPITGYYCYKKEFRWVSRYDLNTQHEYTPTHWMPLPQPPNAAGDLE